MIDDNDDLIATTAIIITVVVNGWSDFDSCHGA